jgi:hypothetical protein
MAALSPQSTQAPAGKAAASGFVEAISCASAFAGTASFDRDKLDAIPREALDHCAVEKERAVRSLIWAIAASDPAIGNDTVAAKMRMAAHERVISRLEAGETVPGGDALEKAGARYITCVRIAINHKLEGVYFGEDWAPAISGASDDQSFQYFIGIGRSSCPVSLKGYTAALQSALQANDRKSKDFMATNIVSVEQLAVKPYVGMAATARRQKPEQAR